MWRKSGALAEKAKVSLPNLNLEPVFVPVPEVFLPMANTHPHKRNIRVNADLRRRSNNDSRTIPIVITPLTVMVVSHHRQGGQQCS